MQQAGDSGYRRRRLAEDRARRLRQVMLGLGAVAVLVAVLALVLAVSALTGGGSDQEEGAESTTPGAGDTVVIMVEEEGAARAAILLQSGAPGTIMAIPADTLLQSSGRFQILANLWKADREAAGAALESLLAVPTRLEGAVTWSNLREAALLAGGEPSWPVDLGGGNERAAVVVGEALASLYLPEGAASAAVEELVADIDEDEAGELLRSLSGQVEYRGLLPGKSVQGDDFVYYEPDMRALRGLVGGPDDDQVEIEVQNGSGVVGITESVTALLQQMGYALLPVRNADDFPDVPVTRVLSARDVLGEGERVRQALRVGQVFPQEDLPPGRIVVILGHDLEPADLPVAGSPPSTGLTGGRDDLG